jgi:hypothetical protein
MQQDRRADLGFRVKRRTGHVQRRRADVAWQIMNVRFAVD